ncbi:mitogen-activated protein kinase kinase kinase 18-like [Dioscorea cayenensis subsp. rotundata]|uniref:Mitogen-activated protein kinase kinase kinase 18-like n=1 Tax=Dioscorea cayennensis subsp. rotundata TaxID=55577 RepID=A0AB40B8A5_DIOCR|nr:mitogen-activated protein kinase kinase kinase 18-like [Dioscorea cayenensis subsp. rotundata]
MDSKTWIRGRTLGHGSFSTVSLASFPSSGHVQAVKSAEISSSGSSSLLHEQRILSSLDSLNIIGYSGFDITTEISDGKVYYNLFMEFAAGGSLSDEIKTKKGGFFNETSIKNHVFGMLSGLVDLHSAGFVHCDVKPENILIGGDGRTKLGDLGCAKKSNEDEGKRCLVRGTPMFMAPEVARGEEQGPAADVWALGCTMIEMATGRRPWPEEVSDPLVVLNRIAFSSDLPEIPAWLSDDAKDFLSKCLVRECGKRWSAEELIQHPFVSSGEVQEKKMNPNWLSSPMSTLHHEFWDSVSEVDDEQEDVLEIVRVLEMEFSDSTAAGERVEELAGSSGGWSWDDEDWMLVRSTGGDISDQLLVDDDDDDDDDDSLNSSCFFRNRNSNLVDCTEVKQYSNIVDCSLDYSHLINTSVFVYMVS